MRTRTGLISLPYCAPSPAYTWTFFEMFTAICTIQTGHERKARHLSLCRTFYGAMSRDPVPYSSSLTSSSFSLVNSPRLSYKYCTTLQHEPESAI